MSVPARDDISRLDVAQQRLATALKRLEGALEASQAKSVAPVSDPSPEELGKEESGKLEALLAEVTVLRQHNADLEGANSAALVRVEETITRLKSVLVT